MQKVYRATVVLALTLSVILPCRGQTASSARRTVWVPPPAGSLLGGGFTDAGDAPPPSSRPGGTTAFQAEPPPLRTALERLNAKSAAMAGRTPLLPVAVSRQASVSVETLKRQRASTSLTYAELLVANSLAVGSKNSFDTVVAMRAKSRAWGDVARQLHVSLNSLISRAQAAEKSIVATENAGQRRRNENLSDSGAGNFGRGRVGLAPGN